MSNDTIVLPRERTLADYEFRGRLTAILDSLDHHVRFVIDSDLDADTKFELISKHAVTCVTSYRNALLDEANAEIEPQIPTEAEIDEMARIDEARRKTGRTPHEI